MLARPAIPAAARVALPIIAASGSVSTPNRAACGQRRPAVTRNLAEPVPGSTTRAGERPRAAQATMLRTTGHGVNVWPAGRRCAGPRIRQNASPSGSSPARIRFLICVTSPAPARPGQATPMWEAASARRCSAPDQPVTWSAPSLTATAASASSASKVNTKPIVTGRHAQNEHGRPGTRAGSKNRQGGPGRGAGSTDGQGRREQEGTKHGGPPRLARHRARPTGEGQRPSTNSVDGFLGDVQVTLRIRGYKRILAKTRRHG